ncbi:type II toxin-antitoxin system HicB family antitoxin [Desulfonema magnum]|uniref:Toxin-antitoxin system, antitoxin component, HigB domain-containing protein n=1 Tax=Desulfonema magnum TaxID=45655 RepID=A0A975GTD2_9BACT|nr:type II toxin-antitoxin system HicB family antitoxin [Desulfonema magnum]QTA92966.1 Toxin-antitoxin system, antitoxin component, HigB domain-containing protein [Desulfonema magnum]
MKREFFVFIEKDEDGFFVGEVPQLRGCYSQGRTLDELMKNITEVIEMCIEEEQDTNINSAFVGIQKVLIDDKTAHV